MSSPAPEPFAAPPLYAGTVDVSSSGFILFGQETTAGTPPASLLWLPILYAGTTWPNEAANRQQVVVKGGSPNNVIGHLARQSQVQATLAMALIPGATLNSFLAACGMDLTTGGGTGFAKPQPTLTIVDVYGAMGGYSYSNMRCNRLTFAGDSASTTATLTAELIGIQAPASQTTASTMPTGAVPHDPYSWSDWQPPQQMISGDASTVKKMECDRWQLVIDFGLVPFYGGGQPFATRQRPWNHVCSGGFTMLDADIEYQAFLTKKQGPLEFKFATSDTTPLFLDIKVPEAIYMTFVRTQGDREYITDVVTFESQTPDWADPVNITTG
jgi:hypothetical protein